MKKIVVVNYDMGRNEVFSQLCKLLQEILTSEGIEVSITNDSTCDFLKDYDVVIFPTNNMITQAELTKKMFPEKMVILWTSIANKKYEKNGIIVMQKGELRHLNEFAEKIKNL